MTVKELRKQLKKMPKDAQVHLEVFIKGGMSSNYGHALGASQSEPNVVVVSNRNRVSK